MFRSTYNGGMVRIAVVTTGTQVVVNKDNSKTVHNINGT